MKTGTASGSPLKSIFVGALRLSDSEDRQSYLEQACGDDRQLRREVEELFAGRDGASSNPLDQMVEQFQPAQTAAIDQADVESIDVSSHPVIGPYVIVERIGEGGMGVVYLARQDAPVQREVALKVIKPGMDSREVVARFDTERQTLALLNHPSVARIHDAGTTESGQPYFAMEYVSGSPITEYVDAYEPSLRGRLQLFIAVCQAVNHAHQKGVIHRDLKPSNILITQVDGKAVPKVIDFGVAKAITPGTAEPFAQTRSSQLVGTPLYMSPEQARHGEPDIDIRSDVYSLGVLLYELLTGVTPCDRTQLRTVGMDEVRRIIQDEEPPRASERLQSLVADASESGHPQVNRDYTSRSLERDLDWIMMKALNKDRDLRYDSANAFADDVRRYLNDEPVEACAPSIAYIRAKFSRRHRGVLASAILVGVTLIAGVLTSTVMYLGEREANRRASESSQLASKNFQLARQAVSDMVGTVPDGGIALATPVQRQLLMIAVTYYTTFIATYADVPDLQAELADAHWQVGQITLGIGSHSDAYRAHRKAYKIRAQLVEKSPENDDFRLDLGNSCRKLSQFSRDGGDWENSTRLSRQALEIARLLCATRKSPDDRLFLARSQNSLSKAYRAVGKPDLAVKHRRISLQVFRELVADYPDAITYRRGLAAALLSLAEEDRRLDQNAQSVAKCEQAVALFSTLAKENPELALLRHNLSHAQAELANAQRANGKPDLALEILNNAIAISAAVVDSDPLFHGARASLAGYHQNLADLQLAKDEWALASTSLAVAVKELKLAVELDGDRLSFQYNLAFAMHRRAEVLQHLGDHEGALVLSQSAVQCWEALLRRAPKSEPYRSNLANAYLRTSDVHSALKQPGQEATSRRKAARTWERLAAEHPDNADYQRSVVEAYERLLRVAPQDSESQNRLAWYLVTAENNNAKNISRAMELADASVKTDRENGFYWYTLGVAHYRNSDWAAASAAFGKALRYRENGGREFAGFFLAMNSWQRNRTDDARRQLREATQWMDGHAKQHRELLRSRGEAVDLIGEGSR